MRQYKLFYLFTILVLFLTIISSCSKTPDGNNAIPYVSVNTQLSINDPQYTKLQYNNQSVIYEGAGYKGIVLINYAGTIRAFERACPYNPTDACATLTPEKGGLRVRCGSYSHDTTFAACCNSKFSLDGNVLQGPSRYPMRQYNVIQNGGILTITN